MGFFVIFGLAEIFFSCTKDYVVEIDLTTRQP